MILTTWKRGAAEDSKSRWRRQREGARRGRNNVNSGWLTYRAWHCQTCVNVCVIIRNAVRRSIVWEAIKGNFPESLVEPQAWINLRAIFCDSVDSLYISLPLSPPLFYVSLSPVFPRFCCSSFLCSCVPFVVEKLAFKSVFISISAHVWHVPFERATIPNTCQYLIPVCAHTHAHTNMHLMGNVFPLALS